MDQTFLTDYATTALRSDIFAERLALGLIGAGLGLLRLSALQGRGIDRVLCEDDRLTAVATDLSKLMFCAPRNAIIAVEDVDAAFLGRETRRRCFRRSCWPPNRAVSRSVSAR